MDLPARPADTSSTAPQPFELLRVVLEPHAEDTLPVTCGSFLCIQWVTRLGRELCDFTNGIHVAKSVINLMDIVE